MEMLRNIWWHLEVICGNCQVKKPSRGYLKMVTWKISDLMFCDARR